MCSYYDLQHAGDIPEQFISHYSGVPPATLMWCFFVLLKEPQQRKYSGTVPPSKRHRLSVDRMQSQYNLIHSSALRERRVRFHRRQVPSVRTK